MKNNNLFSEVNLNVLKLKPHHKHIIPYILYENKQF